MRTRDFDSPFAAMKEAREHDYWPRHRRDGLNVWSDGKREIVLKRERRARSTVWHWQREIPRDLAKELLQ